jgi:hypothetical protein
VKQDTVQNQTGAGSAAHTTDAALAQFCLELPNKENAAHAFACVNACAGINPEAVPELVEILRDIVAAYAHCEGTRYEPAWYESAKDALAKAQGGAS